MKEFLPIVDENDNIVDRIDKDKFDKTTGQIYRTVSLILFNLSGDFLIQRRAFSKATFAGKWQNSAVAGHVRINESYLDAIHRETVEEIGLNLRYQDFIEVEKVFIHTKENKRRFMQVFAAKTNFKIEELTIIHDEVAEIKMVDFKEFQKMIEENPEDFMNSPEVALRIVEKARAKIENSYSQAIL